jgi:hypothetical protein
MKKKDLMGQQRKNIMMKGKEEKLKMRVMLKERKRNLEKRVKNMSKSIIMKMLIFKLKNKILILKKEKAKMKCIVMPTKFSII